MRSLIILLIAAVCGGFTPLFSEETAIASLGDVTVFRTLAASTLQLVEKKDFPAAKIKVTELEKAWDDAEPMLKPKNGKDWKTLDKAIDKALAQVRADKPEVDGCSKALNAVIHLCPTPSGSAK